MNNISYFSAVDINQIHDLLTKLDHNKSDELSEIMSKYVSDKGWGLCNDFILNSKMPPNLVCHNYTFFYNALFSNFRSENIKIFEMGVGVPNCMGSWAGSLLGWQEYFSNSLIFSADIEKDYLYTSDRIKSYYVDQEDEKSIEEMWSNLNQHDFDLIIEDGPHTYSSQFLFYKNSINKLKQGGIYIIEDVNSDFIDKLADELVCYNNNANLNISVEKLKIPYTPKFYTIYPSERIHKMNNLIFMKKN